MRCKRPKPHSRAANSQLCFSRILQLRNASVRASSLVRFYTRSLAYVNHTTKMHNGAGSLYERCYDAGVLKRAAEPFNSRASRASCFYYTTLNVAFYSCL